MVMMVMRPWIQDTGWFNRYARGSVTLKMPAHEVIKVLPEVHDAIKSAFMRVYRAVAFDIDGTLTEASGDQIDPHMAHVVGRLLRRGVPVILISGRGRTWSRKAAQEIKECSGLSDWYLRRLQCITHNGVFLLQTPTQNPAQFLTQETLIAPNLPDIQSLVGMVRRVLNENAEQLTQFEDIELTREPRSVRLIFKSPEDRLHMENALQALVTKLREMGTNLYLTRGSYVRLSCLDLVGTNKKLALDYVASLIGVDADRILRIGDQGQNGGNDFDLLDAPAGFSVGDLSSSPTHCHPVLGTDLQTQLKGAEATDRLLELVLLFPPLSIASTHMEERLQSLRSFEKLAIIRSRKETETVTQQLRVRLRYLLPDNSGFANPHNLEISDIYDELSGAIKFRDWELDDLPPAHSALQLFDIPSLQSSNPGHPGSNWCMYSDTGILMRGPNYYFGLTTPKSDRTISRYLEIGEQFIADATAAVHLLSEDTVDLTRYKLALAIQDNIRNILLQTLYAAFVVEGSSASNPYTITRRIFKEAVFPHSKRHLNLLLNIDADWSSSLMTYCDLLLHIRNLIQQIKRPLTAEFEKNGADIKLFRWRECDHFLQNLTAVQLGLHELRQHQDIKHLERLVAVGLTYGGIELPAIAKAVAQSRGIAIETALAQVSIYGNREVGQLIRLGEYSYVTDLLSKTKPLCMIDNPDKHINDAAFVIMDDNCTTCVTLQLARDFLVMQGADVVGAIAVRFPGVNRHVQMAMPGHGFCDPEILFSFIRGLIAPSPYSRLIYPERGSNPYLDQTYIFDKAKERIVRYLQKNRTPVRKDE